MFICLVRAACMTRPVLSGLLLFSLLINSLFYPLSNRRISVPVLGVCPPLIGRYVDGQVHFEDEGTRFLALGLSHRSLVRL